MTLQQHKPKGNLPDSPPVEIPPPCLYCIPEKALWLPWIFTAPGRLLSRGGAAQHSAYTRDAEMSSVQCQGHLWWEPGPGDPALLLFLPSVLGTPICSCPRSLLAGENALLTLILVLPLHNSTNHGTHHLILCCGF